MTTHTSSLNSVDQNVPVRLKSLSALSICLAIFGLFAVVTGGSDLITGPHLMVAGGAVLGPSINDPWLDSQLRFLGTMWAGWGVLLIWACRDLRARGPVFEILGAILFVAGCGRVASCLIHPGTPPILMYFAALELLVPPVTIGLRRLLIARQGSLESR